MTGAEKGKNLGVSGYSYDVVASLFVPLLSRWGEVIPVPKPARRLESAVRQARQRGLDPVHVSFLPLQDVCFARSAPNVVVPAWEYPDIPNEAFDGNPQNDWPLTANRCSLVVVGGDFTEKALKRAGVATPIRIVPVPTPQAYFQLAPWDATRRATIEGSPYVFHRSERIPATVPLGDTGPLHSRRSRIGVTLRSAPRKVYRTLVRPLLPDQIARAIGAAWYAAKETLPSSHAIPRGWAQRSSELELSGVVYTSILNPSDGRKNWHDLLTGFLTALGDREDAMLVVKLITSERYSVDRVLTYYRLRDIPHRCRLAFISDYLSDEEMLRLAAGSTYYLQATRAEGNCLPLMNYLAAGRPGITPVHSAIADYFDEQLGFAVESHPQPAAWPHDRLLRVRTTYGRIVWPSLVEQIRASYEIARNSPATYAAMGERARDRMMRWASPESVWPRLKAALDSVVDRASGDEEVTEAGHRAAA